MNSPSRISVIVPCKNDARNLIKLIASLNQCDCAADDIIVVDDGSTEPLSEILRDTSIRFVRLENSRGPAFARNTGAEVASGEILLFLDSDVIVDRTILQLIRESFRSNPKFAAVQGLYNLDIPDTGLPTRFQNLYYVYAFSNLDRTESAVCATFCFSVRRSVFIELGGFDTRIPVPTVEDEAFGYLLAARGYTILLASELKVRHLAHYSIRHLIRRKFRMSYHQISHFLQGGNRILKEISGRGKNPTHHSIAMLSSVAVSPLILPALFFHWSVPLIWLIIYSAGNIGFWRFCLRDQHGIRILPIMILTWIDHLTIATGIVTGIVHHLFGSRYQSD